MTQPPWGAPQQPWPPPQQPAGPPPQPWPPQPRQPWAGAPNRPAPPGWPQPPGWPAPSATWPAPPPAWRTSPPARRSGGLRAVVVGTVLAMGLGFFAFAAVTLYLSWTLVSGLPTPSPSTSSMPLPPSPSPTPTESGQPSPGPETYDPPPLPRPADAREAERWLKANALYDEVTTPTDCAITRLKSDQAPQDLTVLDEHLTRTMGCLMQVWSKPATEAGFVLPQPPVRSYDQPITTACGTSPPMGQAAAFYCGGDQRIYYAVNRKRPLYYRTPLSVESTLAHEFGHALQGRTGILMARQVMLQRVETEDEALVYSRRTELQADCYAGVAMNAVAKATGLTERERELLREDNYSRGDREGYPRTHGTPDSGRRWISVGLETHEIGRCNTFSVGAGQVE